MSGWDDWKKRAEQLEKEGKEIAKINARNQELARIFDEARREKEEEVRRQREWQARRDREYDEFIKKQEERRNSERR